MFFPEDSVIGHRPVELCSVVNGVFRLTQLQLSGKLAVPVILRAWCVCIFISRLFLVFARIHRVSQTVSLKRKSWVTCRILRLCITRRIHEMVQMMQPYCPTRGYYASTRGKQRGMLKRIIPWPCIFRLAHQTPLNRLKNVHADKRRSAISVFVAKCGVINTNHA